MFRTTHSGPDEKDHHHFQYWQLSLSLHEPQGNSLGLDYWRLAPGSIPVTGTAGALSDKVLVQAMAEDFEARVYLQRDEIDAPQVE